MRNQKGISLIAIIIIVAIVIISIIIISNIGEPNSKTKPGYELDVLNQEALALSELRLAISKSGLDGSGVITTDEFNTLGKLVKNANANNEWFSNYKGFLYGQTFDTSDKYVTTISDGTYVATFTTIQEQNGPSMGDIKTYLVDYTFEQKTFKGYKFYVDDNLKKDSSYYKKY